jgi:hypothetical protein
MKEMVRCSAAALEARQAAEQATTDEERNACNGIAREWLRLRVQLLAKHHRKILRISHKRRPDLVG